jgi:hypothetical protein
MLLIEFYCSPGFLPLHLPDIAAPGALSKTQDVPYPPWSWAEHSLGQSIAERTGEPLLCRTRTLAFTGSAAFCSCRSRFLDCVLSGSQLEAGSRRLANLPVHS